MAQRTVIVGGGLAGLAAAVALAERQIAVTVLESRPRLGGRASSFVDKASGTQIDNCQHVSLGCCTNFQHFCRTAGLGDLFRTESELYFIGRDNIVNRLGAGGLPAPLHCLASFAKLSYLKAGDLLRISLGIRSLAAGHANAGGAIAFHDWLHAHRQTAVAIDRFWTPVLVSALSETLDRIDVASARKVFVDAFLANRLGWHVQIPTVPLNDLYGDRLLAWLAARGAEVRLQAGVEQIVIEQGRATGVRLRSGETLVADQVIVAVPHWIILDLLPIELRNDPDLVKIRELESAPISSVHLWFDRPILFAANHQDGQPGSEGHELPHAVLIERLSQWVFNRGVLHTSACVESPGRLPRESSCEPPGTLKAGSSYQVVISASRNIAAQSQQETISKVVEELSEIFPRCRGAALLHSRLVTEHRAVFSARPGAEKCRPLQQSPIANLQLAGDWTRTGWPATMEGAVRSGYLAAENVLRQLGRSERLVQPDLPVSRLSRILLGIKAEVDQQA
jgi:squalene-associated FAD-dependent desaturase